MMDLYSKLDRHQVNEGRRLHRAILDWGHHHGVIAYRVLTNTDAYFEFYNPTTKSCSQNFPPKIRQAITASAEALQAYAEYSRREDIKRWAGVDDVEAPGIGSFMDKIKPTQKREGGSECDCHGENWSNSPINSSGAGAQGTGENRSDSQRISK